MADGNVTDVLRSCLKPAVFQLQIAQGMVEGVALTSVNSATTMLQQIETLVVNQYNTEVDEFNGLCDELEKIQEELSTAKIELHEKTLQCDDLNVKVMQAESSAEKVKAEFAVMTANIKDQLDELKCYRKMQPDKMFARIATQRKSIDEKTKVIVDQRKMIAEYKAKYQNADLKKNKLVQATAQLETELKELRKRLSYKDGDVIGNKGFRRKGSSIEYFIYVYEFGLVNKSDDPRVIIINNFDWHFEIKSTIGINLTISVTEWLQPIYPDFEMFTKSFPDELHSQLHELIVSRAEITHSEYVDKMNFAKSSFLEDSGLDKKTLGLLQNNNLTTVYDVVKIPPRAFLASLINSKGFAEKSVDNLYKKLNDFVREHCK